MLGVVFHDRNKLPQLLVVEDGQISVGQISDDERVYDALPENLGEIVEVERNEAARIVGLKSLCCLSLNEEDKPFEHFHEGIEAILADEPESLAELVRGMVMDHQMVVAQLAIEGAEVYSWPDGAHLLVRDCRQEHLKARGDDPECHWCGPNELRKLGLI